MKKLLLIGLLVIAGASARSQKVDSIAFHLYTDSLKKGTYNYINVDGKLSNGQWLPMSNKDVDFSSSHCLFSGNELVIPADFKEEKITVKAILKSNPSLWVERTIWIKKIPDPDRLPSEGEIIKQYKKNSKRRG
jgi:hypothetical protein